MMSSMNDQPRESARRGKETKPARLVAAGIIVREEKILICRRRPDQPMALKWEFPGGKIEPGETAKQALIRELNEELGITAAVDRSVAHIRHTYRSGGVIDLEFFLVRSFEGPLTNRIFHELRWSAPRDLPRYDFLAADRTLIRDLAEGKILGEL